MSSGPAPGLGPVTVRAARPADAAALARLDGLSTSTVRALARDLERASEPQTEVVVLVAVVGPRKPGAGPAPAGRVRLPAAAAAAAADHLGASPDHLGASSDHLGASPDHLGASSDHLGASSAVVVGAALGQVLVDEGHVLDLAVDPALRGGGIGRTLLAALLHHLRERGAAAHTLEVRPTNLAALGLYRAAGFTVEGRRPGYYPDGEDALLLWRRDEEGRV